MSNKLTGIVKMFNGQFGFIKSDIGDIYFNIHGIKDLDKIKIGDVVHFCTEPSKTKINSLQATELQIIKHSNVLIGNNSNILPENIGEIDWFNNDKGFGVIKGNFESYFVHISNIKLKPHLIVEGDICIFNAFPSKKDKRKNDAVAVIFLKEYPITQELINKIKVEIEKLGAVDNDIKYKKLINLLTIVKPNRCNDIVEKINISEQYKFSLWFDGHIEEVDLELVANKIINENSIFHRNLYSKIFARIKSEQQQSQILLMCLEKLEKIDSYQKYQRVEALVEVKELAEQAKNKFLSRAFAISDNERKFNIWFEKNIELFDPEMIADMMTRESISLYSKPYQKILDRITNESMQLQILNIFLNKLGKIDNSIKYEKVKAIITLNKLTEQTRGEFISWAFEKSDNERKFSFWSEKYIEKIDLEAIVDKIVEDNPLSYSNIFIEIKNEDDQSRILSLFLNKLGRVDSSKKYDKVKAIIRLKGLDKQTQSKFLSLAFEKADDEIKFNLWLEKHVEVIDLETIVDRMIDESILSNSNSYQEIIKRLVSEDIQPIVLNLFLNKLGNIDNFQKYKKIKDIIELSNLVEYAKNEFLSSAFAKSDNEIKFRFWYDGIVSEFDTEYFIDGIIENKFTSYPYQILFNKISDNALKIDIINKAIKKFKFVDDKASYNQIKKIITLDFIDNILNKELLQFISQKCSYTSKLRLLNDFTQRFDFDYNLESITEEALSNADYIHEIFLIFEYLIEPEAINYNISAWLNHILPRLGVSDSLSFINHISKVLLLRPLKNKFANIPLIKLIGIQNPNEISYVNNNLSLFPSEHYSLIKSFYYLHHNIGSYRSYSSWKLSKSYLDRISCIKSIFNSETLSDDVIFEYYRNAEIVDYFVEVESIKVFKELHLLLNLQNKETIIRKLIPVIINGFQLSMKNFSKDIKEELMLSLLKNLKFLDRDSFDMYLESEISRLSTSLKLKLWVYDVIQYFDFDQYCFYYFTLNSVEKSIFNKKAKAIMGETLKQAMLKQREPWTLIGQDIENDIKTYSASWKSIWFNEGEIRFCIDNHCNFSKPFTWNFSEEKFNLLFDYISGRKLENLKVWVKFNSIIKVENLEDLETIIWKVQVQKEAESGLSLDPRNKSINSIPINMILRNQCIQLLNQLQLSGLEPTRVLEKTFNLEKGGFSVDISLLYSIPINKNEIAMIWESLELEKSKATHIFRCSSDEYIDVFSDIELYLQSKLKVRSSLNSTDNEDVERQIKMKYLCRIDHDNFNFSKWKKSLCEALPELLTLLNTNDVPSV